MRFGFSGPRVGPFRPFVSFNAGSPRGRFQRQRAPFRGELVYVIRRTDNGHHKVGRSINPEQRIRELQVGSSTPLVLAWSMPVYGDANAVEQAAHAILHQHRLAGEWFDVPAEGAIGAVYGAAYRLGIPLSPDTGPTPSGDSPFVDRMRTWAAWAGLAILAFMVLLFATVAILMRI